MANEAKKPRDAETDARVKPVNLDWIIPEGMPTLYANHMLVQHDGHSVYLLFFDARPPILIGDAVSVSDQFKEISSIPANCVAKIAIPMGRLHSFIQAMAKNAEKIGDVDVVTKSDAPTKE